MAFWDGWPTWVKIAVPVGVVGSGLLLLGRDGGAGEGDEEGGAVLPLITPSTGPSFPLGAGGFGGSDYAPQGGGTGPSGTGPPWGDGPPPTSLYTPALPQPPGSEGGGGPGGTDIPEAPPTPVRPPLTPGQQNSIRRQLDAINTHLQNQLDRTNKDLATKLATINAGGGTEAVKMARRQAVKAAAAAYRASLKTAAAARKVAARAKFGEGRA